MSNESASSDDAPIAPTGSLDDRSAKPQFADLIAEFGRGWEQGDGDRMAAAFAEDGVFLPMPFDQPVRGREAIAAYWKSIPREQAEITFRFGEIFIAGPWFATEIKCTFRRRRTGEWIDLRGAMFCESGHGKITEMRWYWHRQAGR